MASRLFDRRTREKAWLLYAWCRATDDLADGQNMGHGMSAVADPRAKLALITASTEEALAGHPTGSPAFDALGLVTAEANIPTQFPRDVIDGFALDTVGFEPRTEQELYRYCYHVAGAVGCMMAIVMGVPPEDEDTLDRACDLGIAFQLANIARDITEDAAAGRCYLPREWLEELNIPREAILEPVHRSNIAWLASRLADQAGRYEASARYGAGSLSFRSAWAVLAAAGIYGDIAREVRRRGEKAWHKRVTTSKSDKLGWMILAAIQAKKRASCPDPGREGLWTRSTLRSAAH